MKNRRVGNSHRISCSYMIELVFLTGFLIDVFPGNTPNASKRVY